MVDPLTGASRSATDVTLTPSPLLLVNVGDDVMARAAANRHRPFTLGGDYGGAGVVSLRAGEPDVVQGLRRLDPATTPVTRADGATAWDMSRAAGVTFAVDPTFLADEPHQLRVSVNVRRTRADANAGFNFRYESTTGFKGGPTWYTVPADGQWHTQTYTVDDALFVGKWGYHFGLVSDTPANANYLLRWVTVERLPGR